MLALVALVALAAAAVTVAGAVRQGGARDEATAEKRREPPPLELGFVLADPDETRALAAAEQAYERGMRAAARERFEAVLRRNPSSIRAAIGLAFAEWPNGTTEKIREIVARHPRSGVARLHLGLALFAEGERKAAVEQWREAERRDPDSPAAVRAEDLLHPEMAPGRPFFLPTPGVRRRTGDRTPDRELAALRRRAEGGSAKDWLAYGSALQRVGRPVSARAAYDRALALEPTSVEARAAAAVVRFDKDDPSQAFSRLGPLTRSHPRSALVRFHLGLLLLWIGQVDEARHQLRLAADGQGFHRREAARLLARLPGS